MQRLCYIIKCGYRIWPHPHRPIWINHKLGEAVEWHSQWWLCLAGNTMRSEGLLWRRTSNVHPTNDMPHSGCSNGQIFRGNAAHLAGESLGKNVCACVKTIEGVYIVKKKKKRGGHESDTDIFLPFACTPALLSQRSGIVNGMDLYIVWRHNKKRK